MVDWTRFSDLFLDEMIRLEGCGGVNSNDCGMCSSHCPENSIYRCIDCFGGGLICASCMIGSHQQHPFHCIKVCLSVLFSFITKTDTPTALDWQVL